METEYNLFKILFKKKIKNYLLFLYNNRFILFIICVVANNIIVKIFCIPTASTLTTAIDIIIKLSIYSIVKVLYNRKYIHIHTYIRIVIHEQILSYKM